MSNKVYYINTIGLFTLELIFGILIDDVTIIFGFFAGISESLMNFFIPALFYIISCKIARVKPNKLLLMGSYIYIVIGFILSGFALYHNIDKMSGGWLCYLHNIKEIIYN